MNVGSKTVVTSGAVVIGPDEESASIDVAGAQVKFLFASDASTLPHTDQVISGKIATFKLINFNNPLGIALDGSVDISGIKYIWRVVVHSVGDKNPTRVLTYTISK